MSNQSTGVKMERFQDKRHAIEGSRQRVGELSRSFSAAAVEGRQSLDEVMTTVLSAMPIDQQEVRLRSGTRESSTPRSATTRVLRKGCVSAWIGTIALAVLMWLLVRPTSGQVRSRTKKRVGFDPPLRR